MLVFGHRGSPEVAPDNSVAGVLAALDAGAAGVEVDVRRTPHEVLVCCHDPLPGSAAAGADVAPLARVGEVLDAAAGRGRVILEVKNLPGEPDFDAPAERTAHLLVELLAGRAGDDVVVSSFDWYAVEVARAAGLEAAFLTPPGLALAAAVAYAAEHGLAEVHPHVSAVRADPGAVAAAHEAGLRVVCWTVDDPDDARLLQSYGVDGVITNDPAGILAAIGARRSER